MLLHFSYKRVFTYISIPYSRFGGQGKAIFQRSMCTCDNAYDGFIWFIIFPFLFSIQSQMHEQTTSWSFTIEGCIPLKQLIGQSALSLDLTDMIWVWRRNSLSMVSFHGRDSWSVICYLFLSHILYSSGWHRRTGDRRMDKLRDRTTERRTI